MKEATAEYRAGQEPVGRLNSGRMLTRGLKRVYWRFVHPQLQRAGGLSTPSDKIQMIARYGDGRGTLVETGTYLGDTTAGLIGSFARIFTIELDSTLAAAARDRFKDQPSVTAVEGDSATELANLIPSLNGPAVFWLDAHNCGPHTADAPLPLLTELQTISERGQPDVILIDDAHHMGVQPTPLQRWVRGHLLRMYPTWPDTPSVDEIKAVFDGRLDSLETDRDIIRIRLGSAEDAHPADHARR
jgi:hypothetical protein